MPAWPPVGALWYSCKKNRFSEEFYLKKVFSCDIISHSEMLELDAEFVDVPLRDVGHLNRERLIFMA